MGRSSTGFIRENGPGHDLYLKATFARDSSNPFEDGDEYVAVNLPQRGVLLLTDTVAEDNLPMNFTITEDDIDV